MDGEPGDVAEDVALVLRSALAGDGAGVVQTFDKAVRAGGTAEAYRLAWSIAATTVGDNLARGPWRLDFPGIEEAGYDTRWVARFLSACANEDAGMGEALFGAAVADGKLPECLLTLVGSAIATLRHRAGD